MSNETEFVELLEVVDKYRELLNNPTIRDDDTLTSQVLETLYNSVYMVKHFHSCEIKRSMFDDTPEQG